MRALIPPFGVESVGNMALNLVFPKELGDDAQRGDMDSVCAWLDSGGWEMKTCTHRSHGCLNFIILTRSRNHQCAYVWTL